MCTYLSWYRGSSGLHWWPRKEWELLDSRGIPPSKYFKAARSWSRFVFFLKLDLISTLVRLSSVHWTSRAEEVQCYSLDVMELVSSFRITLFLTLTGQTLRCLCLSLAFNSERKNGFTAFTFLTNIPSKAVVQSEMLLDVAIKSEVKLGSVVRSFLQLRGIIEKCTKISSSRV